VLDPAKPWRKEQCSHFFAGQLATFAPRQCELDTALSNEDGLMTSVRSNGAASASGTSGGITSVVPDIAARDAFDAGVSCIDGGSEHDADGRPPCPSSPQVLAVPGLLKTVLTPQKLALKNEAREQPPGQLR